MHFFIENPWVTFPSLLQLKTQWDNYQLNSVFRKKKNSASYANGQSASYKPVIRSYFKRFFKTLLLSLESSCEGDISLLHRLLINRLRNKNNKTNLKLKCLVQCNRGEVIAFQLKDFSETSGSFLQSLEEITMQSNTDGFHMKKRLIKVSQRPAKPYIK